MSATIHTVMFRRDFPIWELQSKDFLLPAYARAVQKRKETLVLSVGDIPQRHGLHADREQNQSEMNKLIGCRQHLRGDGAVRQINRHFVVKVNDKMYS